MPLTLDLSDREREKGNDESKSVCFCVRGLSFTNLTKPLPILSLLIFAI